jgi:multiple sugar transport system substrate-binding protein
MAKHPSDRKLSRRDFLRHTVLGIGAVTLAACAAPAPPQAGGETEAGGEAAPAKAVVTLSFLTQGGNQTAFDRYEPLIANFQQANPDITVEPIWEPGGAIEVQTKLLTLIAAGDAPDAYWAHSYTNAGQAKRNIQMDLTPMIEADPNVSADDFLLAAWKDFQIEGKQIGFPRETTSTIIIYNKELFDKHNLPMPTEDWTWDDFLNAATTISEGEGPDRIYGTADWHLNRNTWIKMWQKGGDVISADRTQYTMNQEPSVSQVREIQSWHHDLQIHLPSTVAEAGGFTTGDLFTTGKIGMFPQFSVFSNVSASEFEWDIAHLPVNSGDTRTTRVASAGHSMYSGTKNPDAAWKWMAYLGSEEAFRHWTDNTGLNIPSLKVVAQSMSVMDPSVPPANAQIMLDAFEYGRPEPVAGDWIGVHREVQPALNSIYGIEKADVQTTLDGIKDRVEELINFVPGA